LLFVALSVESLTQCEAGMVSYSLINETAYILSCISEYVSNFSNTYDCKVYLDQI